MESPAQPARASAAVFLGAIWGGSALSIVLLGFRLYARFHSFRRLFWDDALVSFAVLLSLLSAIIWQLIYRYMYRHSEMVTGALSLPVAQANAEIKKYYDGSMAVIAFFYTSLWAVKFAFLIFFKRLGAELTFMRVQWWIIFGFTLLTYCVNFVTLKWDCIAPSLATIEAHCATPHASYRNLLSLKFNCAIDVVTDFLIMLFPMVILWNVRIPLHKKLALAGLFSLVIITIIFAILRITLVSSLTTMYDTSWLYMWSSVEQNIAIIVACLGSFRTLFTSTQRQHRPPLFESLSRNPFSRKKPRHPLEQSITQGDIELSRKISAEEESFSFRSHIEFGSVITFDTKATPSSHTVKGDYAGAEAADYAWFGSVPHILITEAPVMSGDDPSLPPRAHYKSPH
ncbi:hypothetical protein K458DRAFT_384721 [Lentithecium fluviatile CBS 122367]|uniref:Rhodopsin domain-containing protein n=1 Tax=Lentithecium fluviatile CBS 122367 TaxID=1168545 RepID=A0A6G1JE85_9PLEO|nr:hypothetical protein K458DRAFT_384721 [Lentithecium fluviatile CBS 122367]